MTLTFGSCSPLSSMSWRWRPRSLRDCRSAHSRSLRVTRRRPKRSSSRSHCRDFPEPGPPDGIHGADQSPALRGCQGDWTQSELTLTGKSGGVGKDTGRKQIGDRGCVYVWEIHFLFFAFITYYYFKNLVWNTSFYIFHLLNVACEMLYFITNASLALILRIFASRSFFFSKYNEKQ